MDSLSHKDDDIVYFAECLADRCPDVYWSARLNLEAYGIRVRPIKDTQNIWVRDYMPIPVGDHFVKFVYDLSWAEQFPRSYVSKDSWSGEADPVIESDIILDGGNVVRAYGKTILTDKVVKQNGKDVLARLERLLESEIIIIPAEPGDHLGHSDGICKLVNSDTVLINDYSCIFDKDKRFVKYSEKLIKTLESHNLNVLKFPYAYDAWDWTMPEKEWRKLFPYAYDYNPAFGYYINFLIANHVILLPAMGLEKDREATEVLRPSYPNHHIILIDCRKLSMEGGLINCITWTSKSKQI